MTFRAGLLDDVIPEMGWFYKILMILLVLPTIFDFMKEPTLL